MKPCCINVRRQLLLHLTGFFYIIIIHVCRIIKSLKVLVLDVTEGSLVIRIWLISNYFYSQASCRRNNIPFSSLQI
jgi:formyltetrahydrofolate hydrolase